MLSLLILLVFVFSFSYWQFSKSSNGKALPPGPKPLPFIGNLHQHPKIEQWNTYQAWHKQFGPIISLKLVGFTVIIIGSHKVANDLLKERGRIYSSRPRMIFINECMTKGLQPGTQLYGALWKKLRRLQISLLNVNATNSYRQLQELESTQLLYELLPSKDCSKHLARFAKSVIFTLAFGKRIVHGGKNEFLELEQHFNWKIEQSHWANLLVDVFPVLNRLPECLARWKRVRSQIHEQEIQVMSKVINAALERGYWSWSQELAQQMEVEDLSWDQLCYVVGELYLTGTATTIATLNLCATICTLYPSYMRQAQLELDSVVGAERLPSFEDEEKLPYLSAFISEVFHWRPIIPLGVPHAVSEEDKYISYRIPKDSIIIANQYCLDRDEDIHVNPTAFKPERWIGNPNLPLGAFRFGRRKCPGQNLGHSSIFISFARCLWAYDIVPQKGLDKDTIGDQIRLRGGNIGALPPPTTASFQIRSTKHQEIIEREWMTADKVEHTVLLQISRDRDE